MVKDETTSFITKPTFRRESTMTEAVAEVARIKVKIHKWNNNNIVTNKTTSYISRSDNFGGGNTNTEAVAVVLKSIVNSNIISIKMRYFLELQIQSRLEMNIQLKNMFLK